MTKNEISKVYGKIKIVDNFPDYKVKIVTSFADLHVKEVSAFADSPASPSISNTGLMQVSHSYRQ